MLYYTTRREYQLQKSNLLFRSNASNLYRFRPLSEPLFINATCSNATNVEIQKSSWSSTAPSVDERAGLNWGFYFSTKKFKRDLENEINCTFTISTQSIDASYNAMPNAKSLPFSPNITQQDMWDKAALNQISFETFRWSILSTSLPKLLLRCNISPRYFALLDWRADSWLFLFNWKVLGRPFSSPIDRGETYQSFALSNLLKMPSCTLYRSLYKIA